MNIYNLISEHEIKMIKHYISLYGARGDRFEPTSSVENILHFWKDAKSEYLYKMFKDNLILEKKINFEKGVDEIENDMRIKVTDRYCSDSARECDEFFAAWYDLTNQFFNGDFLSDNDIYEALRSLVSIRNLASNRYDRERNVTIPLPDGKSYRISTGCKVSKAIGKIAKAYNLPGYETFRIYHSQVLNEKSVSGTLCLSIHPLDFMTMSDNDCGWSSCMSWAEHGDFRQGTVEMMNSNCVIVAYLKSSTDYEISHCNKYYWNSKRWRELFIVNNGLIAGIKGYPYWNPNLEKATIEWIAKLAEQAEIGIYEDHICSYNANQKYINLENGEKLDLCFHTSLMYNDFYGEDHQICVAKNYELIPEEISYSGVSECMCCGEILYDYNSEHDLFCLNCDEVYQCCECGEYHSRDDLIEVDGYYYCRWCYEDLFTTCPSCEEEVRTDDLREVNLGLDDEHVFTGKKIAICNYCFDYENDFFDTEKVKSINISPYRWCSVYYVTPEDLTSKGLEYFGFNSLEEALNYCHKSNADFFEIKN